MTPRRTFLPFSRLQTQRAIRNKEIINEGSERTFSLFEKLLSSHIHFRYHDRLSNLKALYAPFDPERTNDLEDSNKDLEHQNRAALVENFSTTCQAANYFEIDGDDLSFALNNRSLFRINLNVDLDDYEHFCVFARGDSIAHEKMRRGLSLKKVDVEIPCYERVALLLVAKSALSPKRSGNPLTELTPGTVFLKLFANVPKADLEMLFPNIEISMTARDRLILVASFIGGAIGVVIKAGAGLLAMGAVMWFMLTKSVSDGRFPNISPTEITAMVGGISALAAIGAFIYKQWSNYRYRRVQFLNKLFNNLYFKNLDNNAGVFTRLIDEAEDEDFKEALLGYAFLLEAGPVDRTTLDKNVEAFCRDLCGDDIDFDCGDALDKLVELGLVHRDQTTDRYQAAALDEAVKILDQRWDDYYQA